MGKQLENLAGESVLQEVAQMTGFSKEFVNSEISEHLGTPGKSVNEMTLDQLRVVLMNYLETVNEEMTQPQDDSYRTAQ